VCINDRLNCFRLLLKDSRVRVDETDACGLTSLMLAAYSENYGVIKWWIASGREVNVGEPGDATNDVIGRAVDGGQIDVATLLERFKENPEETRHSVRMELGWYDEAAAEMFAIIVFVSDGLLQVTLGATRLPLDLQMVLCHRVVTSARETIKATYSELAFTNWPRRFAVAR